MTLFLLPQWTTAVFENPRKDKRARRQSVLLQTSFYCEYFLHADYDLTANLFIPPSLEAVNKIKEIIANGVVKAATASVSSPSSSSPSFYPSGASVTICNQQTPTPPSLPPVTNQKPHFQSGVRFGADLHSSIDWKCFSPKTHRCVQNSSGPTRLARSITIFGKEFTSRCSRVIENQQNQHWFYSCSWVCVIE